MAIAEFANSLLVIPKTLAVNAAQDSADLVAKLRAYHNTSQINTERSSLKWYVISELSGKVLHWPVFTELKNYYRVEGKKQNFSCEDESDLHENQPQDGIHRLA